MNKKRIKYITTNQLPYIPQKFLINCFPAQLSFKGYFCGEGKIGETGKIFPLRQRIKTKLNPLKQVLYLVNGNGGK